MSARAASRLIVVPTADVRARSRRPGDRVLVLDGRAPGEAGSEHLCLSEAQSWGDSGLVRRLEDWALSVVEKEGMLVRAAVRAQVPFLTGWAASQIRFAEQIARTLDEARPTEVVLRGVAEPSASLIRNYSKQMGIECRSGPLSSAGRWFVDRAHRVRTVLGREDRTPQPASPGTSQETPRADAPEAPFSRPDVLVATLQPNATRAFLPVATGLAESGIRAELLLDPKDATSRQLVSSAGVAFRCVRKPATHSTAVAVPRALKTMTPANVLRAVRAMGLPSWVNTSALAAPLGPELLWRVAASHRRAAALNAAIEAAAPGCTVFITQRAEFDEILRPRAGDMKRVFFLQGIVPDVPPLATDLDVDLAIVGSGMDSAYIARCGIPPERVRMAGYADYDHYPNLSHEDARRQLDAAFPAARGRPVVIFTSQYETAFFPDSARLQNLATVLEAARRLPECSFVVRPHPVKERIPEQLEQSAPSNVVFSGELDAATAIKGASVAITYWSTTALEAALLGTPLVQLNATGLADFFDISSEMGQRTARDADQLVECVRDALTKPEQYRARAADFVQSKHIAGDGQSTQRVVAAIRELLG